MNPKNIALGVRWIEILKSRTVKQPLLECLLNSHSLLSIKKIERAKDRCHGINTILSRLRSEVTLFLIVELSHDTPLGLIKFSLKSFRFFITSKLARHKF